MPEIRPFKGILYNKKKVKDLSRVVAPPYDIIPPKMQEELYKRHPKNIVRLILGRIEKTDGASDNRYIRARLNLEDWLRSDVMLQDRKEAFYIYSQIYKYGNKTIERTGFMALMKLDAEKDNKVLPHEKTLLAPKIDRLDLMREVRANLSPIFLLYGDKGHKILVVLKKFSSGNKPIIDVRFDGARHKVWALDDMEAIRYIEKAMRDKATFIADGHHRYEVARTYSEEAQGKDLPQDLKENSKFMMVYFVESDDKMLTILPAHRLIKDTGSLSGKDMLSRLEKYFKLKKTSSLKSLMAALGSVKASCAFGIYLGGKEFYILRLKSPKLSDAVIKDKPKEWKRLDVAILHIFVLQHVLGVSDDDSNIEFVKDPAEAVSGLARGAFKAAFFLNPTKADEVTRIASLGEKMPRKATYFYPKLLSGLIINKLY